MLTPRPGPGPSVRPRHLTYPRRTATLKFKRAGELWSCSTPMWTMSMSGSYHLNMLAYLCLFVSCLNHCLPGFGTKHDSLTRSLFMSLLTQRQPYDRLVLLCADAYCFIFWDLPGDVLAAPESALCGWIGVIPLCLSLSSPGWLMGC